MSVFIAHAPADAEAAESLEKVIERRGQFCELDDGQTALRPVQASDVLVLLLSQDFVFSPTRLRLEQRALDAWSEGRLIVVKLDTALAPVGLRDLPAIDASFAAQREFKWIELANQIHEMLREARSGADPGAPYAPQAAPRRGGGLGWLVAVLALLPGLAALAVSGAIWLTNRIGPSPGGWSELRQGIDQFGMRYGAPGGITEWAFAAAVALLLLVVASFVLSALPRQGERKTRAADAAPAAHSDAVFVSYARANQGAVLPVIQAAEREGRKFWLDQSGIAAGDGWAGEIVRAIRGAGGVMVMCSQAAFESDHVKREIYLADRYRKKLLPVFIEQADPPEDFEYFFAGVQSINLFDTPEAERPDALMRALGAPA